jgi:hypothetical protein
MLFNGMLLGVFVAIHHQAGIGKNVGLAVATRHRGTRRHLCGGIGMMFDRPSSGRDRFPQRAILLAGREACRSRRRGGHALRCGDHQSYVRAWMTFDRLAFAAATDCSGRRISSTRVRTPGHRPSPADQAFTGRQLQQILVAVRRSD